MERYFETMQIFHFSSYFYPLILASNCLSSFYCVVCLSGGFQFLSLLLGRVVSPHLSVYHITYINMDIDVLFYSMSYNPGFHFIAQIVQGHRSISTFQSAGERGSTQSPAQAPLSRVPQGPGRVPPGVWGSWTCPASPVFPCVCSPCPIHLCPLQTPPFTQHFQLLRFTSSEEAPSPCTQGHSFLWALPAPGGSPATCQSSLYSAPTED